MKAGPVPMQLDVPATAVERYGTSLDALRPCCCPDERRLRCGLLYLRDRATAGQRVAGWEAGLVLQVIETLALAHTYATMPIEQLRELHHGMVRLLTVAMALEMRGPGAAPPTQELSDAA